MSGPKVWEDGEFEEREAYLQRLRDDIGPEDYDDEDEDEYEDDLEDEIEDDFGDDGFIGYDEDDNEVYA